MNHFVVLQVNPEYEEECLESRSSVSEHAERMGNMSMSASLSYIVY